MHLEMKYVTLLIIIAMSAISFLIQKIFKKYLDSDQYHYLKEITIVGAWALFGIWTSDGALRITIATAVIAACIGFCQKVLKNKKISFLYLLLAIGYSVWGPRINFIEYANGEYYNLSYIASALISAIWLTVLPLFLQELDETPGFSGLFVTFTWITILTVITSGTTNYSNLSYVFIIGTTLIFSFWSRHLHPYRRLTEPLSALWGTLIAGLSIYAISLGNEFISLTLVPFSLFLIPIIEIIISLFTVLLLENPKENFMFYRSILRSGKGHISALLQIILISSLFPIFTSYIFSMGTYTIRLILVNTIMSIILLASYKIMYINEQCNFVRNPKLWGIKVDNISLNYALSKVENLISTNEKGKIIVTPDALAALRSRTDSLYSDIVKKAELVLPDGAGLILALKLIGTPIQERIPGVEFTEHLCKRASYEGWGVWFLGGEHGVAEKAANKLKEKYPGLHISGTRDGFFKKDEEDKICNEILKSGAKILFIGLGVPRQEYWLNQNIDKTGVTIGMGIGGTMDIISGKLNRAPKIWQVLALEWLYRVIQEPFRWKRVLKLPLFLFYLLLTILHLDFYKEKYDFLVKK